MSTKHDQRSGKDNRVELLSRPGLGERQLENSKTVDFAGLFYNDFEVRNLKLTTNMWTIALNDEELTSWLFKFVMQIQVLTANGDRPSCQRGQAK